MSEGQIQQLCADYQAGMTTRDLAERYDIGKTSVTQLLRERGVPLRHQGLSTDQLAAAMLLYEGASPLPK